MPLLWLQGEAQYQQLLWPALTSSDLQILQQVATFLSSSDNVTWLPAYACALLVLRPPEGHFQPAVNDINLLLVSLDEWRFQIHR